jgi:hypothetical protein
MDLEIILKGLNKFSKKRWDLINKDIEQISEIMLYQEPFFRKGITQREIEIFEDEGCLKYCASGYVIEEGEKKFLVSKEFVSEELSDYRSKEFKKGYDDAKRSIVEPTSKFYLDGHSRSKDVMRIYG